MELECFVRSIGSYRSVQQPSKWLLVVSSYNMFQTLQVVQVTWETWQTWGYLTSNVVWSDSLQPVGDRYTVIQGEFGRRLLVFGFLYNMEDHCDAVKVQKVEEVMSSSWFGKALEEPNDAVVVLAHMDFRDELVDLIQSTVRKHLGPQKPIQILAGHSHIRGFRHRTQDDSIEWKDDILARIQEKLKKCPNHRANEK